MMFMKQRAVEGDQRLPLIICEFLRSVCLRLFVVYFDAFTLDHNEACIDALYFGDELLLADGFCVWLLQERYACCFWLMGLVTGCFGNAMLVVGGLQLRAGLVWQADDWGVRNARRREVETGSLLMTFAD